MAGILGALKAAGISAGELAASATEAIQLGEAFSVVASLPARSQFFSFAALTRKALPGVSWAAISSYFRIGRFWFEQGKNLTTLDPDMVIPRTYARVATQRYQGSSASEQYVYGVTVWVQFPGETEAKDYGRYVLSDRLLSRSEAFARAIASITANWKEHSMPREEPGPGTPFIERVSLESFTRVSIGA